MVNNQPIFKVDDTAWDLKHTNYKECPRVVIREVYEQEYPIPHSYLASRADDPNAFDGYAEYDLFDHEPSSKEKAIYAISYKSNYAIAGLDEETVNYISALVKWLKHNDIVIEGEE